MHKIYCPPAPAVLHFYPLRRILEVARACPDRDPRMANGARFRVEGKKIPVAVVGSRSSSCHAEGGGGTESQQNINLFISTSI